MILAEDTPEVAAREEDTAGSIAPLETWFLVKGQSGVNSLLCASFTILAFAKMGCDYIDLDCLRTNQAHARLLISVDAT